MNYSFANLLSPSVSGLDPAAKAYINAVVAAGASVSGTQKSAINSFVKEGKSSGWYSLLKRLYLPIWASASPNAIDMISGASGTFVGGVTHSSGFVQGNGTTGYFDMGVKPALLGITSGSGAIGWLSNGGGSGSLVNSIGASNSGSSNAFLARWINTLGIDYFHLDASGGLLREGASTISSNYGIITCRRNAGTREISKRNSLSRSVLATASNANSGANPDFNLFAMSFNNFGTAAASSNIRYSAWFVSSGLTSVETDSFTLSLKNLWESSTGLTLP